MGEGPVLTYANDAEKQARIESLRMLRRCVFITAVVYYSTFVPSLLLSGMIGEVALLLSYGVQVVMMVFVVWLGMKVQSLVTGIAMAFLVGVPCAGPCIPFYLVAQANEAIREAERKPAAPKVSTK